MGERTTAWLVLCNLIGCTAAGDPTPPVATGWADADLGDDSSDSSGGETPGDDGSDGPGDDETTGEGAALPPFDPTFALSQVDAALAAGVPGIAVAIVYDGELVFARGFGIADESGAVVDEGTLFNVASLTKVVTALTVLSERDAGLLSLEDRVIDVVPEFSVAPPFDRSEVEIQHLLTHTSGIGDWPNEPFWPGDTLLSDFANNQNQPLWFTPGSIFDYSNRGFALAGLVGETLHGGSFADAVHTRVLEPFAMHGATVDAAVAASRDHARGLSTWTDGGDEEAESDQQWIGPEAYTYASDAPPGGLWVGAEGLGALLVNLVDGEAAGFDPGTIESTYEPHVATQEYAGGAYGLGLFVEESEPVLIHHGGNTGGFLADLEIVPELGFAVAIVVNTDAWSPGDAAWSIVDHYAGPITWPPLPDTVDYASLPGSYFDPWQLGHITVSEGEADQLRATFGNNGTSVDLTWVWGAVYTCPHPEDGEEIELVFWPGADGTASHIVSRAGVATRMVD